MLKNAEYSKLSIKETEQDDSYGALKKITPGKIV